MIFLEYIGSRACLSARLIEYSPVEFILWDFFYDNQSKFLEKVVDQRKIIARKTPCRSKSNDKEFCMECQFI